MSRRIYTEKVRRKVIQLHTVEKLGIKAISKWFNGRPGKTTIERILRDAGVYEGPQRIREQQKQRADRQQRVIEQEKKWRHRMAVCLWNLRKGIGVETTCHQNGWPAKTIWNHLKERPSYRKARSKLEVKSSSVRPRQKKFGWVSKQYPRETMFLEALASRFEEHGIGYEKEPRIGATRYRADFSALGHLIECKVDLSHTAIKSCLGQCWIYRILQELPIVIIIPDDVDTKHPFPEALNMMNIQLLRESELQKWSQKAIQESSCALHPR
jgi:hypothetical protein